MGQKSRATDHDMVWKGVMHQHAAERDTQRVADQAAWQEACRAEGAHAKALVLALVSEAASTVPPTSTAKSTSLRCLPAEGVHTSLSAVSRP